jgi:hypothetical protein
MTAAEFLAPLVEFWQSYAPHVTLVFGFIGLASLVGLALGAKRSGKSLRPVALAVSMNLALLLNAEGMWVVATQQLHLTRLFAVLVFAVFEILFLTATSLAAEQYRRTTTYAADGTVTAPGHPGRMLWVAALIAATSGVVVASNAPSGTEKLLRLAVPILIFLMWWAALTAAGQRARARSRFAYSPRRLAERWGWLIPDDDPDLEAMAAERQARRMVVNHQRVSASRWPAGWWRSRLQKDARTASSAVVDEVLAQLARADRVMAMLAPGALATAVPSADGARKRAARMREMSMRRRVRTAHPKVIVRTVQARRDDPRSAQEKEFVVRAVKYLDPKRKQREVARLTNLPESTVRDALRRSPWPHSAEEINGKRPALTGAGE